MKERASTSKMKLTLSTAMMAQVKVKFILELNRQQELLL